MEKNKEKILFDEIIKKNIDNDAKFGYCVLPNQEKNFKKHYYTNYYSNTEFGIFCSEMKKYHFGIYKSYVKGKGSELIGCPPKMASVASSSRFCYLSLRNAKLSDLFEGENDSKVEMEKDLPVDSIKGTNPQMDAFYHGNNADYFFEFKCHELFDKHSDEISGQYNCYFNSWGIKRNTTKLPFKYFNAENIVYFDLKQFITHLTGIIEYKSNNDKKLFSYMYFVPSNDFKYVFDALKKEIKNIISSDAVTKIFQENKIEFRLYFYKNRIMEGFEKKTKPELALKFLDGKIEDKNME